MDKVAILIDGGYYRKKIDNLYNEKPRARARELIDYCRKHLYDNKNKQTGELYRIFYYDCPPMGKKIDHPLTQEQMDFSTTPLFKWTNEFLNELKAQRKLALRLGYLAEYQALYTIKKDVLKDLLSGRKALADLIKNDFVVDVKQKGVDMKIGIDFILDSMWGNIRSDLHEHIDGLITKFPR